MISFTNMAGDEFLAQYSKFKLSGIAAGALIRKEIYPSLEGHNNARIAVKSLYGTILYTHSLAIEGLDINDKSFPVTQDGVVFRSPLGYFVVNGTLRLAADKCSLNEEYVEKKCDEYLPESIAWVAKPVANVAVEFAYEYFTMQLAKGLDHGINKSRNS
jgi:hypothetical protein